VAKSAAPGDAGAALAAGGAREAVELADEGEQGARAGQEWSAGKPTRFGLARPREQDCRSR